MELPGSNPPFSNGPSPLSSRLLDARTVVVNEALTPEAAGQMAEPLAVLDAESAEPIRVMMSNVPGGAVEAGLSTYDLLRSLTAPVTVLGSGRITGAGLLAFIGAPPDRRFALPHARFRFEEPKDTLEQGPVSDLEGKAQAAAERQERVVTLLAEATGQSEDQIATALSSKRALAADEAAAYGLIHRVVQSRREIEHGNRMS